MKKFVVILLLLLVQSPLLWAEEGSGYETLLNLLRQKEILSAQEYKDALTKLAAERSKTGPGYQVGFKDGFFIQSKDKAHRLRLTGRLQLDGKSYLHGDAYGHDSFFVRRARVCLDGTFYRYFRVRVEPEFGKGSAKLNDGFMNIDLGAGVPQVKIGQFKVPYSLEELHSDNWIDFVERSLANSLAPSRDVGIMLHGNVSAPNIFYQLGMFNGYKMNKATDADQGKDLALRLVVSPFTGGDCIWLKQLHLGGSMTYGQEDLSSSQWWKSGTFKTAAGTAYLDFKDDVRQHGTRVRSALELFWAVGPAAVKSEYLTVRLNGVGVSGVAKEDVDLTGGYLSFVYNLTGENFVYKNGVPKRLRPKHDFDPATDHWGAFQVCARYSTLYADSSVLSASLTKDDASARRANGYTIGLNWYLNSMVRLMLNYNHTDFGDPITVDDSRISREDVILSRIQLAF